MIVAGRVRIEPVTGSSAARTVSNRDPAPAYSESTGTLLTWTGTTGEWTQLSAGVIPPTLVSAFASSREPLEEPEFRIESPAVEIITALNGAALHADLRGALTSTDCVWRATPSRPSCRPAWPGAVASNTHQYSLRQLPVLTCREAAHFGSESPPASYITALNGRVLPADLRRELAAHGIQVVSSATVTVLAAGTSWEITSETQHYTLDLKQRLNVYAEREPQFGIASPAPSWLDALNAATIPPGLRQAFLGAGIPLASNATVAVLTTGQIWRVTSNIDRYLVKLETGQFGQLLNIYDSFAVPAVPWDKPDDPAWIIADIEKVAPDKTRKFRYTEAYTAVQNGTTLNVSLGWQDIKYPTGTGNFPLWESSLLRPAFRTLFHDWENGRRTSSTWGMLPRRIPTRTSPRIRSSASSPHTCRQCPI